MPKLTHLGLFPSVDRTLTAVRLSPPEEQGPLPQVDNEQDSTSSTSDVIEALKAKVWPKNEDSSYSELFTPSNARKRRLTESIPGGTELLFDSGIESKSYTTETKRKRLSPTVDVWPTDSGNLFNISGPGNTYGLRKRHRRRAKTKTGKIKTTVAAPVPVDLDTKNSESASEEPIIDKSFVMTPLKRTGMAARTRLPIYASMKFQQSPIGSVLPTFSISPDAVGKQKELNDTRMRSLLSAKPETPAAKTGLKSILKITPTSAKSTVSGTNTQTLTFGSQSLEATFPTPTTDVSFASQPTLPLNPAIGVPAVNLFSSQLSESTELLRRRKRSK